MVGTFLLGNSEMTGTGGISLTGACRKLSYLPNLSQIRLKQHPKIPLLEQVSV